MKLDECNFFMSKNKIHNNFLDGHSGNKKGKHNEKLLVKIIKDLAKTEDFSWIQSCRRSNGSEDSKGIDIVVGTSFGTMHLQSKSSRREMQRFKKKHKGEMIEVVLMEEGKSKQRTINALNKLKNEMIKCKKSAVEYPLITIHDLTPEEIESYFKKKEY